MRYVIVPEPQPLLDVNGNPFEEVDPTDRSRQKRRDMPPVTLHRYLTLYVFNEVRQEAAQGQPQLKIGVGYQGNRRMARLDRAFRAAAPGDIVEVDQDDWKIVSEIIEHYVWRPAQFGMCLEPVESAWMKAAESKAEAIETVRRLFPPKGDGATDDTAAIQRTVSPPPASS